MTAGTGQGEAVTTWPRWVEALLVVWLGVIALAPSLGPDPRAFLYSDSVLYAAVAKSTLAHGDWLALRLGDVPYFHKPPLLFWLAMLSFKLFGTSTWTAQIVGVVSGLGLMLATWALGARLFDRRHGLVAALVLGTTYVFIRNASVLRMDAWLALTVVGALGAVLAGERRPAVLPLFWVVSALGVLLKGPAGLLAFPVLLLWCLARRRAWPLNQPMFWASLPVVPLVVLPWFLHNWHVFGDDFFEDYAGDMDRIMTGRPTVGSFRKYATDLFTEGWPWVPFLLHGCWLAARSLGRGERSDRTVLPLAWVTGIMCVLLPLGRSYSRYVIPLLPAASLLTATSLLTIWPRLVNRRLLLALGVVLAAGTVILSTRLDVYGDRMPDVVRMAPQIRELGDGGPLPVLGSRIRAVTQAEAIFYGDLALQALPAEQVPARLAEHQPLLALAPHRAGNRLPDGVQVEVVARGDECDLVLLRRAPEATSSATPAGADSGGG